MAYDVTAWNSFLMAVSAAAGALLGLMITAITVRIALVQSDRDLAARAYVLLAVLFDTLASSLFALAPFGRVVIGILIAAFGVDALRNFLIFLSSHGGYYSVAGQQHRRVAGQKHRRRLR